MNSSQLRIHYRKLRGELSPEEQQTNARRLAAHLDRFLCFRKPLRIAGYLATGGEISLTPWSSRNRHHRYFLPKLYEPVEPRLRFAQVNSESCWIRNRFNIIEPNCHWGQTLDAHQLDIILAPLVAFDPQGNRLGMGGGYYDRSLAFRRWRQHWNRPLYIGVAHSLQQHDQLPRQPWDIPLDAVITERGVT